MNEKQWSVFGAVLAAFTAVGLAVLGERPLAIACAAAVVAFIVAYYSL